MENITQYGILMRKHFVSNDTYLFVPEYIIEGILVEDESNPYFVDEMGDEYLTITNPAILETVDINLQIGYVIKEEELLDRYPDLSIQAAKAAYFNEVSDKLNLGLYSYQDDKIYIFTMDINEMFQSLTKDLIEMDSFIETIKQENDNSNNETKKEENNVKNNSVSNIKNDNILKYNAKEMKKYFDEKIIGQEEAKKDVISAIIMNKLSNNATNRNSCLLVGPTGSGKTLIAETVSEYLDLPIEIIDTTQLSIPGYVGANIEDFLSRLIMKAGGDIKKAEEGIVIFDEIDKKGSKENGDVAGKGVLNTLLPFFQGTSYNVKYNGSTVLFDTSKLTIFATGAFTDVANGTKKKDDRYNATTIGFNSASLNETKQDIKYEKLEIEDFVKYGNMPIEIMGRFTTITQLTGHTKESLRTILTDSNVSALLSEKEKLKKIGVDLRWTDGFLDKVVEKALKLKTGGRSLKTTVESSVKEARWEVLENIGGYIAIILTEKTVSDNQDCELMLSDGNTLNLKRIIEEKNKEIEKAKVKKII